MSNAFGLPEHMGRSGSCISCLQGTDTALGFCGDLEWVAAGLMNLGLPSNEAIVLVEQTPFPQDAKGRNEAVFQVCASCVSETNLPAPGLIYLGAEVPTIFQRSSGDPS